MSIPGFLVHRFWNPVKKYKFEIEHFVPSVDPLLIYECHIGMATEEEKVGSYTEFRMNVFASL